MNTEGFNCKDQLADAEITIEFLREQLADAYAEIERLAQVASGEEWLKQKQEQQSTKRQRRKKNYTGHVYLVRSVHGLYKIGRAKSVDSRMSRFEVKLPFPISLTHSFPCDDNAIAEQFLHDKFAEKRMDGEWFNLDLEDVAWLMSIEHGSQLFDD